MRLQLRTLSGRQISFFFPHPQTFHQFIAMSINQNSHTDALKIGVLAGAAMGIVVYTLAGSGATTNLMSSAVNGRSVQAPVAIKNPITTPYLATATNPVVGANAQTLWTEPRAEMVLNKPYNNNAVLSNLLMIAAAGAAAAAAFVLKYKRPQDEATINIALVPQTFATMAVTGEDINMFAASGKKASRAAAPANATLALWYGEDRRKWLGPLSGNTPEYLTCRDERSNNHYG